MVDEDDNAKSLYKICKYYRENNPEEQKEALKHNKN
jgi:hypothetical protein